MILKYGNYAHALGTVRVTVDNERLENDAEMVWGWKQTWNIQGMLTSQQATESAARAEIKTKMAAMANAYVRDGKDVVLLQPDGVTKSHHWLRNADTLYGVKVEKFPSYNDPGPGELVTIARFEIVLSGIIRNLAARSGLKSFQETLQFQPGGAKRGLQETLIGLPDEQLLRRHQIWKVTQQGSAVGLFARPNIPPPLWPSQQTDAVPLVTLGNPRRISTDTGDTWMDWPISWQYQYESAYRLSGQPHVWGLTY